MYVQYNRNKTAGSNTGWCTTKILRGMNINQEFSSLSMDSDSSIFAKPWMILW
ncbi:MAG: hypothetical protein ACYCR7_09055 [Thermoplasmataceae archaeon]